MNIFIYTLHVHIYVQLYVHGSEYHKDGRTKIKNPT